MVCSGMEAEEKAAKAKDIEGEEAEMPLGRGWFKCKREESQFQCPASQKYENNIPFYAYSSIMIKVARWRPPKLNVAHRLD